MVTTTETLALIVVTAALLGIIARKLGQPTITAYIVTGLLLGSGLGLVSTNATTQLLSELGLAFLLFLIGLEIRVEEVREIARPVTVIAMMQMTVTGVLSYFLAGFLGFNHISSLVIAAAMMFSSTAVVVKLLADRDEISSLPSRIDIGILLIQDLVVIFLLALIETGGTRVSGVLLSLAEILAMVAFIGIVSLLSSRYFLPRLFRRISENRHAFFIHGVAWAFLMVSAAEFVGISMEIGAFFAGLAMGQVPYSQELKERVRPLTDFFMAIFFVNIGLGLTASSITNYWQEALIASGFVMAVKFGIIFLATDRFKFTPETSFRAGLNMSQVSEFSLILGSAAVSAGLVGAPVLGFLTMVAIVSMGASSYLITYNSIIMERSRRLLERFSSEEKQDIEVGELEEHLVVIGYDELARNALQALEDEFDEILVIDRNPQKTEELSRSGYEYIYGDFKHPEIRNAARIDRARLLISFSPEFIVNRKVVEEAGGETIAFLKAESIEEAAELYDYGAHYVTVKNLLASEKIGSYVQLYLEKKELFREEVESEKERIRWGGEDY